MAGSIRNLTSWGPSLFAALVLSACVSSREPPRETAAQLFASNCATCHGFDAHGHGPIADILTVSVPDLTRIAAANNGTFPAEKVYRLIDGQADTPVHGQRHMPVWGYEFFGDGDDESAHREASRKIDALVAYLRTLQQVDCGHAGGCPALSGQQ